MIDTIKMMIPTRNLPDNYKEILVDLVKKQEIKRENGNDTFRGWLGNMWIAATNRNLIITGSLTRYAVGDNLRMADKSQLYDAILEIGEKLKTDLLEAPVKRVDIAGNIRTLRPVNQYYECLVDLSGFDRNELQSGLVFQNEDNCKYVHFYDKIKEIKSKRSSQYNDFFNQNILRAETKFFSDGVSRLLKTPDPKMRDVFDNYNVFILEWFKTFNKITKKRDILEFSPTVFSERNEWDRHLMLKGIEGYGGLVPLLNVISHANANGAFKGHKDQASVLKRRMKDLINKPSLTKTSSMVTELEEKVAMIAAFSHEE